MYVLHAAPSAGGLPGRASSGARSAASLLPSSAASTFMTAPGMISTPAYPGFAQSSAHTPGYPPIAATPLTARRTAPSSPVSSPPMPGPPAFSVAAPQWAAGVSTPVGAGGCSNGCGNAEGGARLEVEIARRQAAEARARELEALVAQLRRRIANLEAGGGATRGARGGASPRGRQGSQPPATSRQRKSGPATNGAATAKEEEMPLDDPIDRSICEYLERHPDFPVPIQKVAQNNYVFGDRGTVYITQRGQHTVVRVGGGFKSLQVFMDERALMVTGDTAAALSQKSPRP
eukprot:TRINITY_DN71221_c0_g1_i1.p2 TRINITY_DN71221_c0_g1~~TRINITY_DN71221_c0_g1_i1.p2  ORF type:complete len:290 (+),score=61.81 TRINITY_DN71221_c0_g1_i1:72-941(+)